MVRSIISSLVNTLDTLAVGQTPGSETSTPPHLRDDRGTHRITLSRGYSSYREDDDIRAPAHYIPSATLPRQSSRAPSRSPPALCPTSLFSPGSVECDDRENADSTPTPTPGPISVTALKKPPPPLDEWWMLSDAIIQQPSSELSPPSSRLSPSPSAESRQSWILISEEQRLRDRYIRNASRAWNTLLAEALCNSIEKWQRGFDSVALFWLKLGANPFFTISLAPSTYLNCSYTGRRFRGSDHIRHRLSGSNAYCLAANANARALCDFLLQHCLPENLDACSRASLSSPRGSGSSGLMGKYAKYAPAFCSPSPSRSPPSGAERQLYRDPRSVPLDLSTPAALSVVFDLDETLGHFDRQQKFISIRPWAHCLLSRLAAEMVDLIAWTAADKEWADVMLRQVDPHCAIRKVIHRSEYWFQKEADYNAKDVSLIMCSHPSTARRSHRIVIVDNLSCNLCCNCNHGICVPNYLGGSADDAMILLGSTLLHLVECPSLSLTDLESAGQLVRCLCPFLHQPYFRLARQPYPDTPPSF